MRFLFLFLFGAAALFSNTSYLKESDIHKIMTEIQDQHVEKKTMTEDILKSSIHIYIQQFDPKHVYLLEKDLAPYLSIKKEDLAETLKNYGRGKYSFFSDLNTVFQHSINRSRQIRGDLKDRWIQEVPKFLESSVNDSVFDGFAENQEEIALRIKEKFKIYTLEYAHRFGRAIVLKNPELLYREFDKDLRLKENQYLYKNSDGAALTHDEKENLFSLHVLKALAASLDAHTKIYNPQEAYNMRVKLEKGFEGIGVVLESRNERIYITDILPNTPAAKDSLIQIGDELREVNGFSIQGMDFADVMRFIRQQPGSVISILVARQEGGEELNVKANFTKTTIHLDQDRLQIEKHNYGNGIIAAIRVDSFYQSSDGVSIEKDLKEAIKNLDKENLRGLIIDLRENSGGFLNQAVKVAGLFISNGVVVTSKYSSGSEKIYRDMDSNRVYDGPLIILTSRLTASAAEIVSQALQDYGVALIVGDETTYGKGTIQSQTVTDNSNAPSYFKVTVGKYYTVSGKTPQLTGVKADIPVVGDYSFQEIGEAYLEKDLTLNSDKIADAFDDSLSDIDPNLKDWYLKYYTPTIQKRGVEIKSILPQLKKNHQYRVAHNQNYQNYIKSLQNQPSADYPQEDYQLQEAFSILKDMIYLESKIRRAGV